MEVEESVRGDEQLDLNDYDGNYVVEDGNLVAEDEDHVMSNVNSTKEGETEAVQEEVNNYEMGGRMVTRSKRKSYSSENKDKSAKKQAETMGSSANSAPLVVAGPSNCMTSSAKSSSKRKSRNRKTNLEIVWLQDESAFTNRAGNRDATERYNEGPCITFMYKSIYTLNV
uniref:Uncharacterized protein n=1 Tax=Lygus hesperus TaxID=30085 RepID=A0A0A9XIW1_LYGHE